eukprot:PhF_6_TR37597/c1_g1_i5/m.55826
MFQPKINRSSKRLVGQTQQPGDIDVPFHMRLGKVNKLPMYVAGIKKMVTVAPSVPTDLPAITWHPDAFPPIHDGQTSEDETQEEDYYPPEEDCEDNEPPVIFDEDDEEDDKNFDTHFQALVSAGFQADDVRKEVERESSIRNDTTCETGATFKPSSALLQLMEDDGFSDSSSDDRPPIKKASVSPKVATVIEVPSSPYHEVRSPKSSASSLKNTNQMDAIREVLENRSFSLSPMQRAESKAQLKREASIAAAMRKTAAIQQQQQQPTPDPIITTGSFVAETTDTQSLEAEINLKQNEKASAVPTTPKQQPRLDDDECVFMDYTPEDDSAPLPQQQPSMTVKPRTTTTILPPPKPSEPIFQAPSPTATTTKLQRVPEEISREAAPSPLQQAPPTSTPAPEVCKPVNFVTDPAVTSSLDDDKFDATPQHPRPQQPQINGGAATTTAINIPPPPPDSIVQTRRNRNALLLKIILVCIIVVAIVIGVILALVFTN